MTEYIIVVALIAIAAIGVVSLFGDNIRDLFGASGNALAGNEATTPDSHEAGEKPTIYKHQTLKNFAEDNQAPT
jgi:Flp pilus assembly pilin Flp